MSETASTGGTSLKKSKGHWSETCIGLWSQSISTGREKSKQTGAVCSGINVVRITNMDISSVKPTNTVGIQVIIHDTEVEKDLSSPEEDLSLSKQMYSSYEKKLQVFENNWNIMRRHTADAADSVKRFASSPRKVQQINSFLSKEYNDLRKWFDEYWK